jgi:hypothetical protein
LLYAVFIDRKVFANEPVDWLPGLAAQNLRVDYYKVGIELYDVFVLTLLLSSRAGKQAQREQRGK